MASLRRTGLTDVELGPLKMALLPKFGRAGDLAENAGRDEDI